jgi:putative RNA 2'-phosphotransferase
MTQEGLRPAGRQHVHLSTTPQAALEVGRRHAAEAVVVVVFARRAARAGGEFRQAGPALFLTGSVAPEFLLLPHDDEGPRGPTAAGPHPHRPARSV